MMQRRVFLIVLDSLGVGALPDAEDFGDTGAHTLDHIVRARGSQGIALPHMVALGLGHIAGVDSLPRVKRPRAAFGRCAELSPGKDTSTGHWEMMGCPVQERFPTFPNGFPPQIIDAFLARTGLEGVLENRPASGTEVIDRLGAEHIRSGWPIVYTSADSVFQVAAHEEHFGLKRLLDVCSIARELLNEYGVGRVIARPFVGEVGHFERTYNRRDFSLEPPSETVLDRLLQAGREVIGVGKIEDIFAARGLSRSIHTEGNADGVSKTIECAEELESGLVFVNLVDFDMLFGHRRNAEGYAAALEEFDRCLPQLESCLRADDVVMLTADHGNDPTFSVGTDHTREYIPVLAFGPRVRAGADLGTRSSFADVGATVEELLGLAPEGSGQSFATALMGASNPAGPQRGELQ